MYDLVVQGGTVVTPSTTELLDVAVQGETIAALGESGSFNSHAAKIIDASGCYVMPGGVDPHTT